MIPKTIHYCWFGGGEKPVLVQKCIASWKTHLEGYTFIEWNEDNFDLSTYAYAKEAYEAKKYAFVSDVARLVALKNYGGIYLDTDVEVLKTFDPFLDDKGFCGFEERRAIGSATIGAEKDHPLIAKWLSLYEKRKFLLEDGSLDKTTNVELLTSLLDEEGLVINDECQEVSGLCIYPTEYFCPKEVRSAIMYITDNTYCIHHFDGSWLSLRTQRRRRNRALLFKIFGKLYTAVFRLTHPSK